MRVFLDANIYLKFIRSLSDERLDSLNKFKDYATDNKFAVVFPQITQDEVFRKIPRLTNKGLVIFSNLLPNKPQMKVVSREISNKAVSELKKEWKKEISKIEKSFDKKIEEIKSAHTDSVEKLIEDIIEPIVDMSEKFDEKCGDIIKAAKERKLKGNPPGKRNDPLGDEIAWELMKKHCTDDNLTIISEDSDWMFYRKDIALLNPLLKREWGNVSKKKIVLRDTVGSFINTIKKKEISKKEIEKEKSIPSIFDKYVSLSSLPSLSPSPFPTSSVYMRKGSDPSGAYNPMGTYSTNVQHTTMPLTTICSNCSTMYSGDKCRNCS